MLIHELPDFGIHIPRPFVDACFAGGDVVAGEAMKTVAVFVEPFISCDFLPREQGSYEATAQRGLMDVVPGRFVQDFGHRHAEGICIVFQH